VRTLAALLMALALAPAAQAGGPARAGMVQKGFELVGYVDLRGGEYGDLTTLGSTAFVGTRCGPQNAGGAGVKVASFADPHRPKPLSTLAAPPLTRAEDVAVRHVQTTGFRGDLALVGLQTCRAPGRPDARTGFRLFDVTKPAAPVLLSEWLLPEGAVGCHEVDLVQRADGRVLAACARNLLDQYDAQTRAQRTPAVQLVDVTDPRRPAEVLAWSKTVAPFSGTGCLPVKFAHSARFENRGQTLYVSYWDAGTILLDLADLAHPTEVATVQIPTPDGDNHSMTIANGGRWLVINPEDFSPSSCGTSWGGSGVAWVYDNSDPTHPHLVGSFGTANAARSETDVEYTVHNSEPWKGRELVSSWYADGIVRWTLDAKGRGHQLGQFVPGHRPDMEPLVWGVAPVPSRNLVLLSDMPTGLWIVRPTAASAPPA
jgi:hypothetical protein